MATLEECMINCQELFAVYRHFELCEKTFESNATEAKVFFLEGNFFPSCSSIISAYPDVLKLASAMMTYWHPVIGCLSASPQASASAVLIALYSSSSSSVTVSCVSILGSS